MRRTLAWLAVAVALLASLGNRSYVIQDRDAVLQAPSHQHWMGTDEYGRDVAARLWVGTRNSCLLATAMALPSLLLALVAGLWGALRPQSQAAWRGAGEVSRGLPWIFLLVAVRAALPLNAGLGQVILVLLGLFTLTSWPIAAWTMQGAAQGLMQQDFIAAARLLGTTRWQMVRRHLWPNLRPLAMTYFLLLFASATGAEVSLALIGLGVPAYEPTWGNMLLPLRDITVAAQAWWLFMPLLVLVPVLAGLNVKAMRMVRLASRSA